MTRGDVVVATAIGGFGAKPRPYIVIQSDSYVSARVILLGCTTLDETDVPKIWPRLTPTPANGLQHDSAVMVDNVATAYRSKVRQVIGRLSEAELQDVEFALILVLGLAEVQ